MSDDIVVLVPDEPLVIVEVPGAQGATGLPGGGFYHLHEQMVPASEWIIVHGLGNYPVVSVMIDNEEVDASSVEHVDVNTVRVEFPTPQAGKAVFS